MSKFKESIISIVSLIPRGKVVSYGQVALYVGMPRAARQVGWILNGLEEKASVPWWRVVNNKGRISIKGSRYSAVDQKELLEAEGILINQDLTFDIERYRFIPDENFVKNLHLEPHYLELIADKIRYNRKHGN